MKNNRYNKIMLTFILFVSQFFTGCESSILEDPSTIIDYKIPQKSYVKMTIENSYNTVIATLVDGEVEAGQLNVSFNMNNLPEGIYFYTIEIRGIATDYYSKTTKPVLLIKP
jgi:hypothetical protein